MNVRFIRWRIALRLSVLAFCGALLFWAVDWRESLQSLQNAEMPWLALAVALLTVQTILSAQRWRITAAELGISISLSTAIREYYLAQVINQSLPGGVIGDAGRAVRARGQMGLLASSQAVIFERFAGQLGLLALLLPGLAITLALPSLQNWPAWLQNSATLILAGGVAALAAASLILRAGYLESATKQFRQSVLGPRVWREQAVLSLGTAACNVTAFGSCTAAVGADLHILAVFTLVPLILFAMVLPLSVGGWGLREGAAAGLFPAVGLSAAAGLASSIAFGLVLLVSLAPALILLSLRPKGAASEQQTRTDVKAGGLQRGVEP